MNVGRRRPVTSGSPRPDIPILMTEISLVVDMETDAPCPFIVRRTAPRRLH
jgi:hypothetical protein